MKRIWIFNVANVLDCITTTIGLSIGAVETNPIVAYSFLHFGVGITFGAKLLLGHLALSRLVHKKATTLATFACVLVTLVVISNVVHIVLLRGLR